MGKLWVRWVALALFVVIMGAVFVRLGEWQLHRLEHRRETNAQVVAREKQPAVAWQQAVTGPVSDADQWQKVTVSGTFDPEHSLIVRYRSHDGVSGAEIVTPLRTSDNTIVLINRGFLPRPKDALDPVVPPAPTGEVTVTGYLRRSEVGKDNATVPMDGTVRLINAPAIGRWLGSDISDGYLQVAPLAPGDDPALQPLGLPALDEGPHLSYAVQWFMFTGIAVFGAVVLVRGDLRERRKLRTKAAAVAGDGTTPADDAGEQPATLSSSAPHQEG